MVTIESRILFVVCCFCTTFAVVLEVAKVHAYWNVSFYCFFDMKKSILLLTLCLFTSLAVVAEEYDLIITTERSQIHCIIQEISDVSVRYVRSDRPQTIVFSTPLSQVVAIVYRDGTVEQITPQTSSVETAALPANEPTTANPQGTTIVPQETTLTDTKEETAEPQRQPTIMQKPKTAKPTLAKGGGRIYREKNEYMYNDSYISAKEVGRILQTNAVAHDSWQRAHRLSVGGIVLSSLGAGTLIVSLCCIPAGIEASMGVLGGGVVLSSVGVGLLCGSLSRYDKAIDIYNTTIDSRVQLHVFASPTDVGLALRF